MMEGDAADIHEGCKCLERPFRHTCVITIGCYQSGSSSRSSLQLFVSKNGQATVSGTDIR